MTTKKKKKEEVAGRVRNTSSKFVAIVEYDGSYTLDFTKDHNIEKVAISTRDGHHIHYNFDKQY